MAQEARRGCGFRKVGGLYLVGAWTFSPCDRLPIELVVCPVCGQGIKFTRGITRIDPLALWDNHRPCACSTDCSVCWPPSEGQHYIMWVGERHYPTPDAFRQEARAIGISKRIAAIPRDFVAGETVIYLAHKKTIFKMAFETESGDNEWAPGVFMAWKPIRAEKLFWESQRDSEEVKKAVERGITPVFIKDGDEDHTA